MRYANIIRRLYSSRASPRIIQGPPLQVPDVMVQQHIFNKMAPHAKKTCLIDKAADRSYTFEEVIDTTKRTANGLSNMGMGKEDVMIICKNNSADYIFAMLGTLMTGAAVCTVNPVSTVHEMKHYFKEIGKRSRFVTTDPDFVPLMTETASFFENKFTIITSGKECAGSDVTMTSLQSDCGSLSENDLTSIDPKTTPAFILFSSGTTGLPKGVLLSHRNAVASLSSIEGKLHKGDIGINVFPMFHGGGIFTDFLPKLCEGITQVISPRFDFKEYLKDTQTYRPHTTLVPPPVVVLMAKSPLVEDYDVSSIQKVITGAAPTKQEVEDECRERLNNPVIGQALGMTETASVITIKDTEEGHGKPGSIGQAVANVEVKVINPDSGEMLGPNATGELCFRSPQNMLGYLNKPEETAAVIDKEGWIHSGDLGYYDEDDYFFIIDRIKELIKYKGFQVAPAELDAVILEHPDVAEAAVIGIPDKMAGELPRAYVVKKKGKECSIDDITEFVAERVSYYKKLRGGVVFVDSIPKLSSGKLLRRKLKEQALKEMGL